MALVVTGMHRSGTSAVAGLVDAMGLSPGDGQLMETVPENPRGFFEREDVADFNDQWLARLGGSWSAPPATTLGSFADLSDDLFHRARPTLDIFAPGGPDRYVKDPRISLLLPVWDRLALRSLPVVLVVRSPQAVAESLRVRNSFPLRTGLALWLTYLNAVVEASIHRSMFVLDYDELLAEPSGLVQRLGDFVDAQGSQGAPRVATNDLIGRIEPQLRRQTRVEPDAITGLMLDDLSDIHDGFRKISGGLLPANYNPAPVPEWAQEALGEARSMWKVQRESEVRVQLARRERDAMEREYLLAQENMAGTVSSRSYRLAVAARSMADKTVRRSKPMR